MTKLFPVKGSNYYQNGGYLLPGEAKEMIEDDYAKAFEQLESLRFHDVPDCQGWIEDMIKATQYILDKYAEEDHLEEWYNATKSGLHSLLRAKEHLGHALKAFKDASKLLP